MHKMSRPAALAIVIAILVSGCATAPVPVPEDARPGPLPEAAAAYAADVENAPPGEGATFRVEVGEIDSEFGCRLEYEYHRPNTVVAPGLVVLAHGFMRDLSSMRGWAEQWAALGIPTVVVSFCNSGWFNGHHDRNAADLRALAGRLASEGEPVLYAGFSAGGLSALLAAAADSRAIGYLGLDPVDSGELASTVGRLRVPALYLYGEPSGCNAQNNMLTVMPEGGRRIALRIPYATHCDFENPTDGACARLCGSVAEPVGTEVRRTISALATAWVSAQMTGSPAAAKLLYAASLEELERARRVGVLDNR